MTIKGIVFDLDDTLVYTNPYYWRNVVRSTLLELGVEKISNDLIDKFWYDIDRNNFISNNFGILYNDFWDLFVKRESVEVRRKFTRTYSDARILQFLKSKGVKTGVLTSASISIMDMELELLDHIFDGIVSANYKNGIKEKPDPEGLLKCLELMNVSISYAAIVGNGVEDILTGKNAGAIDVLVDRGNYKSEVVPSYKINSLMELEKLFFN